MNAQKIYKLEMTAMRSKSILEDDCHPLSRCAHHIPMFSVVGAEGGDIVQRRQPTHKEASADNDKEGERLRQRPLQLKTSEKTKHAT